MRVYIYTSHWHNGPAFEGSIYSKAFKTLEEAQLELNQETEQAIDMITEEYGGYYQDCERENNETYHIISDSDEYQNDWWEGIIVEQEL